MLQACLEHSLPLRPRASLSRCPRPIAAPCLSQYPKTDSTTFFQLLGFIADSPAPTVPTDEDGGLSARFAELISLCLDKEPSRRPSAKDLLRHEWIRMHADASGLTRQDSRRDDGPRSLERSRSNVGDLEVTGVLEGLKLS